MFFGASYVTIFKNWCAGVKTFLRLRCFPVIYIEIEIEIVFIILESMQNFSKRESRYRT